MTYNLGGLCSITLTNSWWTLGTLVLPMWWQKPVCLWKWPQFLNTYLKCALCGLYIHSNSTNWNPVCPFRLLPVVIVPTLNDKIMFCFQQQNTNIYLLHETWYLGVCVHCCIQSLRMDSFGHISSCIASYFPLISVHWWTVAGPT